MRVSEIRVKRIRVNQGLGVYRFISKVSTNTRETRSSRIDKCRIPKQKYLESHICISHKKIEQTGQKKEYIIKSMSKNVHMYCKNEHTIT